MSVPRRTKSFENNTRFREVVRVSRDAFDGTCPSADLFFVGHALRLGDTGMGFAAELHQLGLQAVHAGLQLPHLGTQSLEFHRFKMFPDLMGRQHLWIPSLESDIPLRRPLPEAGILRVADHTRCPNRVNTKPPAHVRACIAHFQPAGPLLCPEIFGMV